MGPEIYVGSSEIEGRGVFSSNFITKGSIIEICPVIIIPKDQVKIIHSTVLHDYYFNWLEDESLAAIALGFGSLYNHSYSPNAKYDMDFEFKTIEFIALKDIEPHNEILTNYNGASNNKNKLWFNK